MVGAIIVAVSIAFTFRYSFTSSNDMTTAHRLDRWTGVIRWCVTDSQGGRLVLNCEISPKDK